MKKHVPDPPSLATCTTVETSMGHCPDHPDLFAVRPGVKAEDALVHMALLLKCARLTCTQTIDAASDQARGFAQCTEQTLELALGLATALLGGLER
ncbi:hypothetical protein DCO48_21780 [Pseudomonas sp. SDI]|uniref:hypothetical protein n=1 Tax=Pseudomonas sp. SDI TaxID=2170734 RepID=UPI000DE65276|nr:hypothetical protein [Pseudomonas sp. SDI]PWB29779.1 hypothetical protein DCO48_21780 [Pseudomonas sp. SDI]